MMNLRPGWPVWMMGLGALLAIVGSAGVVVKNGMALLRPASLLRPENVGPTTALLIVAGVVGLMLFILGDLAYVIHGSTTRERAERGYGTIGTILACLLFALIVTAVVTFPVALAVARPEPGGSLALTPGALVLSVILQDGIFVGTVYLRIVHPGVLSWEQLGLRFMDLSSRVGLGLGVGVLLIGVSEAIALVLSLFGVQQTQEQMFEGVLGASFPQFFGVLLAVAIFAPVCEEIFFRGYVFTASSRRYGVRAGILFSSLVFALVHLNLQAFLPLFILGAILAYVYSRTGSLVPGMVAHATNNAIALLVLYFGLGGGKF